MYQPLDDRFVQASKYRGWDKNSKQINVTKTSFYVQCLSELAAKTNVTISYLLAGQISWSVF